jgi:type I restriction enzyme S subunit
MIQAIDITAGQRDTVRSLLARHLPNTEAWVYGSRVRWTSRPESDLDIAVFATPNQARDVSDLREAFEDSNLPFRVDLFVWDEVPESFRQEIERDHVVLVERPSGIATDDWLYVPSLPAHWRRRPLYSMAQWVNGLAFRDIQFSSTGRPVIKIAEIKGGISDQTKFTNQTFDDSVRVRPGDLLFAWSGQPESSINAFWWRGSEGWLNQHVFRVTPCPDVDRTFLFYLLRYLRPNFVAIAHNKQTTGLGHVTKQDLQRIRAAAPSRDEQHAIAHVLGMLDDKIELNRCMNETLEAIAQALFKSWFVDFEPVRAKMEGRDTGLPPGTATLFPDRMGENGLPLGWRMSALGEHVANFDFRRVPVSRAQRADMHGPFPYHGAAGVLDHVNDYLFDGTFLLLGEDGSVMRENGLAITQYVSGQFWVNNHAHVLQGKGAVSTEQAYLHFAFEPVSPFVTGAVQPKLSQRRMNQIPFVYAGEAACRAFGQATSGMFSRLRANARESDTLATIRGALLPKLISGEIRVQEAEKTVAGAL